jgi:hypothetical protein
MRQGAPISWTPPPFRGTNVADVVAIQHPVVAPVKQGGFERFDSADL